MSPEQLDRILHYGSLAPSPHNAQAWRFDAGADSVTVCIDRSRRVLEALDPRSFESYFACGAAVTNLVVGARSEGLSASVEWLCAAGSDAVARVSFSPDPAGQGSGAAQLTARQTNRSTYLSTPIEPAHLLAMQDEARAAGLALSVVTERDEVGRIAALAERAGAMKLEHNPTRSELHRLMRYTPAEAARHRDGLDLERFGVSAPMARISRHVFRDSVFPVLARLGLARALAKEQEGDLIRSAPAVLLLSSTERSVGLSARAGACFQSLALRATELGLALQPHSAAVEVTMSLEVPVEGVDSETRRSVDRELRAVFNLTAEAQPQLMFRMGFPSREVAVKSLRRPVGVASARESRAAPGEFSYEAFTTRNGPVLSAADQTAVRGARCLIAGCGSIGGSAVEPMVRLGFEKLVLAEPGRFELNNLNRQNATLADLGEHKAEVLKRRALEINSDAEILIAPEGVTEENVAYLVGATDLVIDGVDVTEPEAIAMKRLLHREAHRQRRPIIMGLDLGGAQVVRVDDHRQGGTRPFAGRLDPRDGRLSALEFLGKIIQVPDVPLEFLAYVEGFIAGRAGPAPQLGPTALQFGVIASWAAMHLMTGRPVRERIRVDLANLVSPTPVAMQRRLLAVATAVRLRLGMMLRGQAGGRAAHA